MPKWYNNHAMPRKQVRCCDCGFLSLSGAEDIIINSARDSLEQLQLFKELGMIGLQEVKQKARDQISDGVTNPAELSCARSVWSKYDMRKEPAAIAVEHLNSRHTCPYYFKYVPGYTPREHLELQREHNYHKLLLKVSLISAAVGAGIATLVNIVLQ